ncbi:MAG TPA: TetR/AcrR family transcriptional regulator, partial [Actinomycetota bacterium]|nr:TetR/AcrR family transcriptional regulator [Actinomycetota bacterium]
GVPRPRTYRGQLPEERRAGRRRRLLDAALELFATVGYPGVSIERLCAEAGVTARHFYQEFPSREALLTALFDETAELAVTAVTGALGQAPERARTRSEAGVGAFVHAMLDDPRRARILCVESVGVSAELEQRRRSVIHTFALVTQEQAERLIELGDVPSRDFSLGALALVGGMNEVITEWVLGSHRPPLDDLVEEFVRMILAVASLLVPAGQGAA